MTTKNLPQKPLQYNEPEAPLHDAIYEIRRQTSAVIEQIFQIAIELEHLTEDVQRTANNFGGYDENEELGISIERRAGEARSIATRLTQAGARMLALSGPDRMLAIQDDCLKRDKAETTEQAEVMQ